MIFAFGEFEIHPNSRALYKDRARLRIEPKPFDIILYLIKHRDRAVEKDELISAVWGDVHLSETALTRSIMKARKALSDSASDPVFIKTIHGHGYQFGTDVVELSTSQFANKMKSDTASIKGARIWRIAGGLLTAAALVFAISVSGVFTKKANGSGETRVAILPLENSTGDPDLDWTELGLMRLMSNVVGSTNTVHSVPSEQSMKLFADADLSTDEGFVFREALFKKFQTAEGATHIVASRLLEQADVYTLEYAVFDRNGEVRTDSAIGNTPTTLARLIGWDVLQGLGGVVKKRDEVLAEDANPFASEAVARGTVLRLQGDLDAASKMFEAALESDPDNESLTLEYAIAMSELAKHEKAKSLFDQLLSDLDGEKNPKLATRLNAAVAYYYANLGEMGTAKTHREAQLRFAQRTGDDAEIGKAFRGLGDVAAWTLEFDEARTLYLRSRRSFELAGLETPPGYLLGSMAILEARQGNYALADQYFNEAVERFKLEGDEQKVMYTMLNIGILRYESGNWRQAGVYFDEALALARAVNDIDVEASALVSWGLLEISNGDFDRAEAFSLEALSVSENHGYGALKALSLRNLGMIARRRLELSEADRYFTQLYETEFELDNQVGMAIAETYSAKVLVDKLQYSEAGAKAKDALKRMKASGGQGPEALALSVMADAELGLNNMRDALEYYKEALAFEMAQNAPVEAALIQTKLGRAYLDLEDVDKATEHLELAESLVSNKFFTYRLRAQIELKRGENASAAKYIEIAKDLAQDNWTDIEEQVIN